MKQCLLTLVLGVLGVCTIRAGPLTQIAPGNISRYYSYAFPGSPWTETDSLTLDGSTGDLNFRIGTFGIRPFLPFGFTTYTDQITERATLFCFACPLPHVYDGTLTLTLDVHTYASFSPPFPGPDTYMGYFTALGSFSGPEIDMPLTGMGTTTLKFVLFYDRDPGFYYYAPSLISYDFVAIPEPAMMFTTGLGLLALMLLAPTRRLGRFRRH